MLVLTTTTTSTISTTSTTTASASLTATSSTTPAITTTPAGFGQCGYSIASSDARIVGGVQATVFIKYNSFLIFFGPKQFRNKTRSF